MLLQWYHIMLTLWSWSYGSWIYNYLCNQCLSSLKLWVRIPLRRGVLDTTICDKVCHWLVTVQWVSLGTPISSAKKTYITEIMLKVALNTINQTYTKKFNSNNLTIRYRRTVGNVFSLFLQYSLFTLSYPTWHQIRTWHTIECGVDFCWYSLC